nr:unnamed protein product [Callosobruchus chinensis]
MNNTAYIVGDFNIPEAEAINLNLDQMCPKARILKDFLDFNDFVQLNDIRNSMDRSLDLVLGCHSPETPITVNREHYPLVPEDTYHPALSTSVKVVDECVPKFKFQSKYKKYPCWYDKDIIDSIKLKNSLHKQRHLSHEHMQSYCRIRESLKLKLEKNIKHFSIRYKMTSMLI